jgi:hypothetical protein
MLTLTRLIETLTGHIFVIQTPFEVSFAPLEISRRALRLGVIFVKVLGL